MANLIEVNHANFEREVKGSDVPFLVDFSATWCGPCKVLAPVLEEIATDLHGKIKIGKVDVDKDAQLAGSFGIMSVPAMLLFKGGEVQWQEVGAMSKAAILDKLNPYL